MMITAEQIKIDRLEREQKVLMGSIASLLNSVALLIPYTEIDQMPTGDVIEIVQSQKTTIAAMATILFGE